MPEEPEIETERLRDTSAEAYLRQDGRLLSSIALGGDDVLAFPVKPAR